MDSFRSYMLRIAYKNVQKLGDRLARVDVLIDWEAFRPIVAGLYRNDSPQGRRPNVDEVVMVKLLVLQQWYGLSDPEFERKVDDRLSFQRFLGFPDKAPDYSTVWQFREPFAETGRDRELWAELQRQLDDKGLKVRKGVAQDATFITSDHGHAPAEEPREEEVKTRSRRDSTWAKKGSKFSFGYKLHKDRRRPWPHQGPGDDHGLGARQRGRPILARGSGVQGQGVLRRRALGIRRYDEEGHIWPTAGQMGQAEERED